MARGKDKKQLQILVDASQGVDQLGYLTELYKKLKQEARTTNDALIEKSLERDMASLSEKIQDVREELGLEGMTVVQLTSYYKKLKFEADRSKGSVRQGKLDEQEKVLNLLNKENEAMSRRTRKEKLLNQELKKSIKANGLKGLSLDQLKRHHRSLTEQIEKSKNFESAINKQRIAQAQRVESIINKRRSRISSMSGGFSSFANMLPVGGGALSALGPLGALAGATLYAANGAMNMEEAFTRALQPLQNITESAGEFNSILAFLDNLANTTGQDLLILSTSFKSIYAASKQAGISLNDVEKIYKSIISAGSTLKLSNSDIEGSLRAVEQMISKGKVSSEELRQQLGERLPGAYGIMAKAAGVSTQELDKQLKAGEIMAVDILPKFADELEKAFGAGATQNIETQTGATNRLSNEWKQFMAQFADQSGLSNFWINMKNGLASTLRGLRSVVNSTHWTRFFDIFTAQGRANLIVDGAISEAKAKENDPFNWTSEKRLNEIKLINDKIKETSRVLRERNELDVEGKLQDLDYMKELKSEMDNIVAAEMNFRANKPKGVDSGGKVTKTSTIAQRKASEEAKLAEQRIANEAKVQLELKQIAIKAIEDETERKVAALRLSFETEKNARIELVEAKKMSQESYDAWLKAKEIDLNREVNTIEKEALNKLADEKIDRENKVNRSLLQAKLKEANTLGDEEAALALELAILKHDYEIDLAKATAEEKKAITANFLAQVEAMNVAHLDAIAQEELSKIQTTRAKERQIEETNAASLADAKLQLRESLEDATFSIIRSSLQRELQEAEYSHLAQNQALQQQKNDGYLTDEQFSQAKIALEKKQEEEIAKIKRKQFLIDKAAALSQIAINTAIAASKAAAQTGVGAGAAVPFIIAAGAAQAAAVIAEPVPSFAAGGFTPSGIDGIGGMPAIIHPNEYVIPASVTQTPTFAAIAPMLESARRKGANSYSLPNSSSSVSQKISQAADVNPKLETSSTASNVNASAAINKLVAKLDNLKVYFGGSEIDRIRELLAEDEDSRDKSYINE